jgi:serine/threonine protein kinase
MVDAGVEEVASQQLGVGKVIDGKYRIDSLVGEGGMGVIWKATQLDLDRSVAIKVVREEFASNEEVVNRTLLEARAAARLRGEHIVRVLDVGRLSTGAPYIVMEHLEGRDLYTDLAERLLPMPVNLAVDLVLEACEGLAEAHAAGIVHRDLKPENLFIAEQPDGSAVIKILDFGISKEIRSESPRAVTNPATVIGSPQYMSPEQMRGSGDVDARADIWSLGATLYELLVGQAPFHATTIPALCSMVLEEDPTPPRHLRADVPIGLEAVVLRCLKKDRDDRYGSIGELAHALVMYGSPSADDRAARIARVISGIRPRHSYPGERLSEMPTLRESAFDNLNSLQGNVAPIRTNRPPRGPRWHLVALLSAALALPIGFGAATGVTSLQQRLAHADDPTGDAATEPRRGYTAASLDEVTPQGESRGAGERQERKQEASEEPAVVVADPVVSEDGAPHPSSSQALPRVPRGAWVGKPAGGGAPTVPPKAEPAKNPATTSLVAEAPPAAPQSPQAVPTVTGPSAWDPKSFGGRR